MAQDGRRLGFVQHLEAWRHARLEREALQERLAESVDGEDVDAAGGVKHAREQAAGDDALLLFGRPIDQGLELLIEFGLVGHGPTAELAGQAVAHLGGRGLGEGETEDALGPRPGE